MLLDATGAEIAVGDRIGTCTSGRWSAILTAEVERIGAQMITCRVLTAQFSGAPLSTYAYLPEKGAEIRLNAFRVFKLVDCSCRNEKKR